jgi:hypothetical protein
MFSIFKQARDPQGRDVIELGMNEMLFKAAAIAVPLIFLATIYFVIGTGPAGLPWFLIAAPLVFMVIGYPAVAWICRRYRLSITIDKSAGKFLLATSAGQSEIRMADVSNAEFASVTDSEGTKSYRLEFIMRSGERVPATAGHFSGYAQDHQTKTLAAINGALGQKPA